MKNRIFVMAMILVSSSIPGMASADAVVKYCAGDASRLCVNVKRGQGRIYRCLVQQRHMLTPECKVTLEVVTGLFIKHAAKVCGVDIKHYCGKVQPGAGRIMRCLKRRYNQLENGCAAVVAKVSGRTIPPSDEYSNY